MNMYKKTFYLTEDACLGILSYCMCVTSVASTVIAVRIVVVVIMFPMVRMPPNGHES